MAVMALVGRPFLKADGGELGPTFGPLGIDGMALSQGVFGTILEGIGWACFGLDSVDVNGLRTAQDTLAVEHVIELGLEKTALCLRQLAVDQRTSETVSRVCGWHQFFDFLCDL